MKTTLFIALLSTSSFRMCGDDPPPPPPVTGAPVSAVVEADLDVEVPEPSHGGHVVVVDRRPVEVVVQDDGEVHAWMLAPEPPPPGLQMVVHVHGHDGHVHPVSLAWNAEAEVWAGRLVEVRPAPGPIELHVAVEGHVHRARIARVHVVRPRFSVFVDHEVDVHVPGPPPHAKAWGRRRHGHGHVDVHVHGPTPPPPPHFSVHVEGPHAPPPPHLRVHVDAPRAPRPHVRVGGRAHGGVHVHGPRRHGRHGHGRHHRRGRH